MSEKKINVEIKKEKKPTDTLDKIKSLIFLGKLERVITIDDMDFVISSLTAAEQTAMLSKISLFPAGIKQLTTGKIVILAFALKKIDNILLDDIVAQIYPDEENILDAKIAFLDSMQVSVTETLHSAYQEMVKDIGKKIEEDKIKKS